MCGGQAVLSLTNDTCRDVSHKHRHKDEPSTGAPFSGNQGERAEGVSRSGPACGEGRAGRRGPPRTGRSSTDATSGFNATIHAPNRLRICAFLDTAGEAEFSAVQEQLGGRHP